MKNRRVSTDNHKIKGLDGDQYGLKDIVKSPKYSDIDINVSENNASPKSFLKSIYNRSDWSALRNVQLKIPKIEHKKLLRKQV